MRSFTLDMGLNDSSLNTTSAPTPRDLLTFGARTSGVRPMVSMMLSKMRPMPSSLKRF
jgi:hypothetical protein